MKKEVYEKLKELIYKHFEFLDLNKETIPYLDLIDDLGMDSLSFVSLLIDIEENFDLIIPDEVILMDNFRDFQSIVETIYTLIIKKDVH